jgi:hypothetical protein
MLNTLAICCDAHFLDDSPDVAMDALALGVATCLQAGSLVRALETAQATFVNGLLGALQGLFEELAALVMALHLASLAAVLLLRARALCADARWRRPGSRRLRSRRTSSSGSL